jgi:uncharacterized protein (DUF4213/DUF364 family)
MVIDETLLQLRKLYGDEFESIAIERIVIGVFFTGVKLSGGFGGVGYTPASDMHEVGCCASMAPQMSPGRFKGMKVAELAGWSGNTALTNIVRLVTMNALSQPFLDQERYRIVYDTDALDVIDMRSAGRIGMVGAFIPFLKRLKGIEDIDLSVVEQKKETLKPDEMRFYVPAEEASMVLPACDTVIITGASIANGTIEHLLGLTKRGATVLVTGPTAGMLPDALFARNASVVSGAEVTDVDEALDLLAEGAGAYRLFTDGCVRKINIFRE